MSGFFGVYVYFILVLVVTAIVLALSRIMPAKRNSRVKYMPYESGVQTETHLFQKRSPLRHYLVGLIFLVFDVEVVFLYPWAVVAKEIGPFAFYEMLFFLLILAVGFAYVWKHGGLEWE